MLLQNAGGENISAYCILDSDYHTPGEIRRRIEDANNKNVRLHIWRRKTVANTNDIPRKKFACLPPRPFAILKSWVTSAPIGRAFSPLVYGWFVTQGFALGWDRAGLWPLLRRILARDNRAVPSLSLSSIPSTLEPSAGGRMIAAAGNRGGGKSELRRAVCRITSGIPVSKLEDGQCNRK